MSQRAMWPPSTALADAYFDALVRWAITHHTNIDAHITLPTGRVNAGELLQVLRALEKTRQVTEHRA
jgi:hypothetical protein